MKRKWNVIMLFFIMIYLLTGCQNKDAVEMETEIELSEESTSVITQDTTETETISSEDGLGINTFHTDSFEADDADTASGEESIFDVRECFYHTELTDEVKERITGKSYPDTEEPLQISYGDLAYVHVLYYDFQAQVQEGELVCNQSIAQDLVDIFYELYESRYPIGKICLVDEYGADDEASMADNNTSCFNYRRVPGRTKLSNHAYGYAIDINPLYNPYVRTKDGKTLISPDNAVPYADRDAEFPYKIDKDDLCYKIFIEHGFSWGGAWNSSKDYQHFEKVP